MSWPKKILLYGAFLSLALATEADVMVQLNINRPINDVSDKFVSFIITPEDLYKALDSSNRKTVTQMASMLSNSHVKFVGDYHFASKNDGIRLRNPTKIVWKGFNKWTKAVNWSMIIPVPYKPDNWDPMETLNILNTSQMVDIDEAIWQLGTDFGSARAADYVNELKTFNIMVDSFKHSATNWQTMGADISAGSSPEETGRYVELSRDLNAAYGWIQSENMFSNINIGSPLNGQDPALKVLFKSKVPVWLSFPKRKTLSLHLDDEVVDGLSWAQTMGEAANVGFDSIFKHLTLEDMEQPKYGFYVTAFFKKIMGSRVYPARPLGVFNRNNMLYTHCANMVSGGLAFMVVNKQEHPLQITVKPVNKLLNTEVWQYALTMQNGQVMLNNNRLSLNSTIMPEVRKRNSKGVLQLKTPGLSVSFWVLPDANLEHCHFAEVETPVMPADYNSQKIKRYSSSDRLLKELIKESVKPSFSPIAGLMRRHRRSADKEQRLKRFVLEGTKDEVKPMVNFAENLFQEMKSPLKRDILATNRRDAAINWLSNIFKEPLKLDLPLLKRNARQSDLQKGRFFITRNGKKTSFTKKITEIKRPEKKVKILPLEDQEFDEEKFFKSVVEQPEPEYVRVPEGDVFLRNIVSADGDDLEEELKIETTESNIARIKRKKIVSEMKPLRLLPTEFFETLPPQLVQSLPDKLNMGPTLNSLIYSDVFDKTYDEDHKNFHLQEDTMTKEIIDPETHEYLDVEAEINHEDDDLIPTISRKRAAVVEDEENVGKDVENLSDAVKETNSEKMGNCSLFVDSTKIEDDKSVEKEDKSIQTDEKPWWDLSDKRLKRSLDILYPAESWHNNMIMKDNDPITAANELSPVRLSQFEHKVEEVLRTANNDSKNKDDIDDNIGERIINTFKEHVTKFLDILSQEANEWYNTFTKKLDSAFEEPPTTEGNRIT